PARGGPPVAGRAERRALGLRVQRRNPRPHRQRRGVGHLEPPGLAVARGADGRLLGQALDGLPWDGRCARADLQVLRGRLPLLRRSQAADRRERTPQLVTLSLPHPGNEAPNHGLAAYPEPRTRVTSPRGGGRPARTPRLAAWRPFCSLESWMLDAAPPPTGSILRIPGRTASPRTPKLLDVLPAYLGVRYTGVLTPGESEKFVDGVYHARDEWTSNLEGGQFTLGRAWYTHLEEDREDEYFEGAADSDALVRQATPGLQEQMTALVARLVGGRVVQRPGWCGAGVHIFPAR